MRVVKSSVCDLGGVEFTVIEMDGDIPKTPFSAIYEGSNMYEPLIHTGIKSQNMICVKGLHNLDGMLVEFK